jgi:hypothetical protein
VRVFWGTIGLVNGMVIIPVALTLVGVYGPFNWLLNATYSALQAGVLDDIIIATSLTVGFITLAAKTRPKLSKLLEGRLPLWYSNRDNARQLDTTFESPPQ